MTTYFISDIHLHADSKMQKSLLSFLQTKVTKADALYIVGDLFSIWLGDDLNEPYSEQLKQALRALHARKVPVFLMRGNRDFLIGDQFCRDSGCQLLQDPTLINVYGRTILLTHGDQLCTLDISYQKFRKFVQSKIVRYIFLKLPIMLRRKLGAWVKTRTRGSAKNPASYDVEDRTVQLWFERHNVDTMIHGHTHKPNIHNYAQNTRIVLGDWEPTSAKILSYSANGYALIDLCADQLSYSKTDLE